MRPSHAKVISTVRQFIDGGAQQQGDELLIICPNPDHDDRSRGSCHLNIAKQVWYCFACGAGGSVKAALRLRGHDGVELPTTVPHMPEPERPQHNIDPIVLSAYEYHAEPWIEAGFDEALLAAHRIGYDVHHRRITIPLYDRVGNLIGISGRATQPDQEPRYKVYKRELGDFVPYDYAPKIHNHLWRLHMIPDEYDELIICEGFKAALWVAQCGFENVVAICGASMTDAQADLVKDRKVSALLMLDNDQAGRSGASTSAIKLSRRGVSVKYVEYDAPAPDDLSPHALSAALAAIN